MLNMRECFEEYGADYTATMERFMNNEELYLRLLRKFFLDDTLTLMGAALEAGDKAGAFEAAHTLKGVVGNLGLTPLYRVICAIVDPLRMREERDDYPALLRAVQTEFHNAEEFLNILEAANMDG